MKKIVIVSQFTSMPNENIGNSRVKTIINFLLKQDEQYDIELISTTFSHLYKEQREYKAKEDDKYKFTLLYEPGYRKNVSLKRFYSHYIFGKKLYKYLNNMEQKPDVIYCLTPSLDAGKACAKYAKKNNIRFVIDVQDIWPEAFKLVFNIPIISNLIFYPMKKQAEYTYKQADDIIAVSDTYANIATKVNKKYKNKLVAYLGTDLEYFDKCKEENRIEYNDDIIRVAYVGTLGHSYDIKNIINAINILNHKGINNIKFMVMGNGPLKEEFGKYAKEKNVDVEFTGRLEYPKMIGSLCACDIAVNPIAHNAAQSIINKVGDYAAAGLPVVSTQECEEYRNLVNSYNVGYNCTNEDVKDIAEKIELLAQNKNLREELGKNNRKLAEEKFDRNITYKQIVELVKKND